MNIWGYVGVFFFGMFCGMIVMALFAASSDRRASKNYDHREWKND